jgi:hypothetical protein
MKNVAGWQAKAALGLGIALFLAIGLIFTISESARFAAYSIGDFILYGYPTDKDRLDAEAARNIILVAHHFERNSLSQPTVPPVFVTVGSSRLLTNPTVIHVYEVNDSLQQDQIIAAVRGIITARQSKSMELRFFDHENWNVDQNVARRGPEKLLRRVLVHA